MSATNLQTQAYWITSVTGIQNYIFEGNKLREMIGASNLADQLTDEKNDENAHTRQGILYQTLDALLIPDDQYSVLTAAASQARIRFKYADHVRKLAYYWPLVVNHCIPGATVSQSVEMFESDSDFNSARKSAEKKLILSRNCISPNFPVAHAGIARSRRTGKPAVELKKLNKHSNKELVDLAQSKKLKAADEKVSRTLKKILPEEFQNLELAYFREKFPENFEDISASNNDENEYLAVIHADGNGLGKIVQEISQAIDSAGHNSEIQSLDSIESIFKDFSSLVDESTCNAVKSAFSSVFGQKPRKEDDEKYPFRPILCAGDDLTLVMRASDALDFSETFLQYFEAETEKQLKAFKDKHEINTDDKLTAGLGIAFVKRTFPFHLAYQLSESLVSYAKDQTNRQYSALAFHKVTSSSTLDYKEIVAKHLTLPTNSNYVLNYQPYTIEEEQSNYPHVSALRHLIHTMQDLPRGALRQVLSASYVDIQRSQQRLKRLHEVSDPKKWKAFVDAWNDLSNQQVDIGDSKTIFIPSFTNSKETTFYRSPLMEAIELRSLMPSLDENPAQEQECLADDNVAKQKQ